MRLYLLQLCVLFYCTFSIEYCQAQVFNAVEVPVVPCGGRNSNQVDVRGSRAQRKTAEIIIADFKRDSIGCTEPGQRTLLRHQEVRIDLQDPRYFERNGKRWRNLQVQQNVQRVPGFPTTVATVLIQCDKTFPIRIIRNAFVRSMTNCAMVWLDSTP